jgi:uncharacterized membrane protein YbhN (UPF0104 family)
MTATAPSLRTRRWLRTAAAVVVVGAVVWFAGRQLPSWSELTTALGRVDLPLLGAAALLEVFSLWLFARQQQMLFAGFGVRIPVGSVVAITYSRPDPGISTPARRAG